MEFWGIEVKPGETVKCYPGDDKYLHLSQASLGEAKKEKGNESIPIHLKFGEQKLVIGTLSADKCPQITYDLVFEKEFELSHSWKNGSIFFVGYKTEIPDEGPDDFMDDSDSESEEDTPVPLKEANGKPEPKVELSKAKAHIPKADSLAAKPSVKSEEIGKAKKANEDHDSDEDDDDSEEDESDDDDDMLDGEGDSDNEDESSEEVDDATPKKAEIGKKRAAESASKTPATDKKAKLVTTAGSQKIGGADGKKGGHTATPHPAKQAGKTPVNDKSKQQTPKSGSGSVSCKTCSRTFKDDNALQAHTKAKHTVN